MSGANVARWMIDIYWPDSLPESSEYRWGEQDKRVLANLPAMLEAVEEDLTSMLPEGYRAIIKERRDA